MSELTVTAEISTKDRYFTTLPMAIITVASQSYPIDSLIIYDDGEGKDLRTLEPYINIFNVLDRKGIKWKVLFTPKKGQVTNHDHCLRSAETDLIWRLDDDDFAESDTLTKLVSRMAPDVGAVSGKVWSVGMPIPAAVCSPNKIEDIRISHNIQWSDFNEVMEVDHIYNTFLYRRKAGLEYGYPMNLSPVGHGEETLFTYGIKLAGYKLILDPNVVISHLKASTGGIRTARQEWFIEDERKTDEILLKFGVKLKTKSSKNEDSSKLIVLDNGLGDHFMFKMILPEIKEKYKDKKIVLAVCYPEVFEKEDGISLISIAAAKSLCDIEKHNVYKYCEENKHAGHLVDAFRKIHL